MRRRWRGRSQWHRWQRRRLARMRPSRRLLRRREVGPPTPLSKVVSCTSRLCRTHRRDPIFVNLNYEASRVCAAREAPKALWTSRDDRVGVGAGLDHVTLFDLLIEEGVEAVPALA